MPKQSYFEGWGYSDTIKLLLKGSETNRNSFFKELKTQFPKEDIEKSGANLIEAFVYERQIPTIKKMARVFNMKVMYEGGGKTDDIEIAKIILQQLGGQGRLVVMTGAYNFVAIRNGVSFKIKNRSVNYVEIKLNGKDLYDVKFGRIAVGKMKVKSEHNDVYFDELIPLFEKETGMYLRLFKKGGFVSTQNRDMVVGQLKSIHHHEEELRNALKTSGEIEAWVLAKVQRATTDLSDVTHYIDARKEFANGGMTDDDALQSLLFKDGGMVDLFEDYEKIPTKVQVILDKYAESFEDGDYQGLAKAHKEIEKIGYTFEYYLDGQAYGLRPNNVPLNKLKGYEEFAKGGKTKTKGAIGKSGQQYGYTLQEWESNAKKMGLLVSPSQWWKSRQGIAYKDSFGRNKKIGMHSSDEMQEMSMYGYLIANGLDLGSKLIPLSAKKYVIENNYQKFEDGGMPTQQGFSVADANPYIAGAKAVQGIAPQSVSALDQRLASKINPDPNRPVFF